MNTAFFITCGTTIVLIGISVYIITAKSKRALHYSFLNVVVAVLIWTATVMLKDVFKSTVDQIVFWENATYLGAATVPVSTVILAKTYAQSGNGLTKKYFLLYIVPVVTLFIIWTNPYHHLFYEQYAINGSFNTPGIYFYFHAAYSYVCLIYGCVMLSYYAIKNSGILSIQALLILMGSLVPAVVNVFYTLELPGFDVYSTPIAFAFTCGMYLLGMFRFNLLKVSPIALQTVINRISDSFIVVDSDMNVLDYNQAFSENFNYLSNLRKGVGLEKIKSDSGSFALGKEDFCEMVGSVLESNMTQVRDVVSERNNLRQYYTVELTPIFQRNTCSAVIMLFKNITQHVRDMEKIKENQAILIERERLASLGQMIGGIAHNLKTPIMSIAGGIEQLQYLTSEYETSVGDPEVTENDHKEIAKEMQQWLGKMKLQTGYMSDIISTVKDQATKFTNTRHVWFTLDEMLKRVKILMQHEIIKNHCKYTQDIRVDKNIKIAGDINSMVQILDNVIVNAIQAYDNPGGEILLQITKEGNKLLITVCDFGKGIDEKVKDRLFKEMITTKGKHGTGLGLYMSYSTVKGMFRGNMWFESNVGKGTKFFILLPLQDDKISEVQGA